MENPYLRLTSELNEGRLRALLSSGQAVVVHRLAVMSKDGDWILREDAEATSHVLRVLEVHGARYRFGAPLDPSWLEGGWSSHFEYRAEGLRIRTDFVSRPPRVTTEELRQTWEHAERTGTAVVGIEPLAAMKLTNREKDYAVVGELARRLEDPRAQLRFSRSARDLLELARRYPELVEECTAQRPLLRRVPDGRDALEEALDRERRALIRANEGRLARYQAAAASWAAAWPETARRIAGLPLRQAHQIVLERARGILPQTLDEGLPDEADA